MVHIAGEYDILVDHPAWVQEQGKAPTHPWSRSMARSRFQSSWHRTDPTGRTPTFEYHELNTTDTTRIDCLSERDSRTTTSTCNIPLQSFMTTMPKIWSCAFSILMRWPNLLPGPTKNAVSSSKSNKRHWPHVGGTPSPALNWPHGRWIGVPEMTTLEDLTNNHQHIDQTITNHNKPTKPP
jgi:hypothetical protein